MATTISGQVKAIAAKAGVKRLSLLRPNVYYVGEPNLGSIVERRGDRCWLVISSRGQVGTSRLTRAFELAQAQATEMETLVAEVEAMTDDQLHAALADPNTEYVRRQHVIAVRIFRGIDR